MEGFFKWFKSSTKVKRWILLMLIGIVLVCYGIAEVIVTKQDKDCSYFCLWFYIHCF